MKDPLKSLCLASLFATAIAFKNVPKQPPEDKLTDTVTQAGSTAKNAACDGSCYSEVTPGSFTESRAADLQTADYVLGAGSPPPTSESKGGK